MQLEKDKLCDYLVIVITIYNCLGMDPGVMLAELLGKVTGCARGKVVLCTCSLKNSIYGRIYGIVGGQVPLAVGAGQLNTKRR